METIRLATWIDAPMERCFQLSLSIDLHVDSARKTGERAIDGVTTGLIAEGESVTFQAHVLGVRLRHTSLIETLRPYSHFRDVMVAGVFQRFEHDHHFAPMDDGTRVRDEVRFSAKWGPLGRLATKLFLRRRLTAFLMERNAVIKRVAESEEWRKYLDGTVDARDATSADGRAKGRWDGKALLRGSQIVAPQPPRL
jgi:ligand-binding SRPBCC domain-containing protein